MSDKKKVQTFKERYDTDPEFKEKHKKYICEKVECDCGRMVMRVAMATHKRSNIHKRIVEEKNKKDEDIEELVERLVSEKIRKILKESDI